MRTLLFLISLTLPSCGTTAPGARLERTGDEISVCGQLFHIGSPVVLWNDPGGYDAYRATRRFGRGDDQHPEKQRYNERATDDEELAARVAERGWTLDDLRAVTKQFVLHYDVAGTAHECFRTLEARDLSVHFLLDIDGTIYQTLDLKERAWHASQANSASVGIEIAHIGAYPQPVHRRLKAWYTEDSTGVRIQLPKTVTGPRGNFIGRPARRDLLAGVIHGKKYWQFDYTEEQYRALTRLCAALHRVLPGIELEAPRDADGRILRRALNAEELAAFRGVLGHYHVTTRKIDPGPAFDWERVLEDARALVD